MKEQFKYVDGLNTIRFVAILLVIVGHWGVGADKGQLQFELIRSIIPWGKFGLAFFLVLSGFLISSILFKVRRDMTPSDNKLTIYKNFLIRRALRLLPVYYLVIVTLFIVGVPHIRLHIGYYLTHTANILFYMENVPSPMIHVWSLSVQEQLYVLLPLVILYANEKWIKYFIYGGILLGIGSKFYVHFVQHKEFAFLVFNSFDSLGFGVLYAYHKYKGTDAQFEKTVRFFMPLLLYYCWQFDKFSGFPVVAQFHRTMWSVMSLGIIMYVLRNENKWLQKHFFENKTLNYFGKISYGIYLYHYIIGAYMDNWATYMLAHGGPAYIFGYWPFYVIKLGTVLVVASLSYNYFETPIINLKKKFSYLKKAA